MMEQRAKYPVGIQTFEKIREEGFLYADKTRYVYDLANSLHYVFLTRPRRFGKSLLLSTFSAYFSGRKDLFTGLAAGELEKDWTGYPVLCLSLASAVAGTLENLEDVLDEQLYFYEKKYGIAPGSQSPGARLYALINEIFRIRGQRAVVLIDEYDTPLLSVLGDRERLSSMQTALTGFYAPLKTLAPYLRFVLITGITKFASLPVFEALNNFVDISLRPEYSAICGITEEELESCFSEGMAGLAGEYGMTEAEALEKFRRKYLGWRFTRSTQRVYSPFSLLSAMALRSMDDFWFSTGSSDYLLSQIQRFHAGITELDGIGALASEFDAKSEDLPGIVPLLYQSGYLTIKDYDRTFQLYTLGFPNGEVKVGFIRMLIPYYVSEDVNKAFNACRQISRALMEGDADAALTAAQSFFTSIPRSEGTLKDARAAQKHFTDMLYGTFSFLSRFVPSEVRTAPGRMDILVKTRDTLYVMELRIDGSAEEALSQTDGKGYAIPWKADGRKVVKAGISFSSEKRTISEWKVRQSAE